MCNKRLVNIYLKGVYYTKIRPLHHTDYVHVLYFSDHNMYYKVLTLPCKTHRTSFVAVHYILFHTGCGLLALNFH